MPATTIETRAKIVTLWERDLSYRQVAAEVGVSEELRKMTPHYKLIYFNARGRAEHIRFIFAYAGIEYEDERISREKWPELKKKTPFGLLPVLEIDGKPVAQSNAIARHLAKQYGLAGKTEWESLQCDVLVDALGDLKQEMLYLLDGNDLGGNPKQTDPPVLDNRME
ncbi:glutathione s-transferase [Holotrichia oblita]|uniref:Glutathione s-transferase n=1 Tax=Holotrichia oblita TaxID=644536 RepID=A0ACB9TU51_HOLOL|nr:glutathione s-transferase [Holotrichia oblita]